MTPADLEPLRAWLEAHHAWLSAGAALLSFATLLAVLLGGRRPGEAARLAALETALAGLSAAQDRLGRTLDDGLARAREEQARGGRELREEVGFNLKGFNDSVLHQLAEMQRTQAQDLDTTLNGMRDRIGQNLAEFGAGAQAQTDALFRTVKEQHEVFARTLMEIVAQGEVRGNALKETLEAQLKGLREDNAAKLEQMRVTVDEKLQGTLEQRLGQSFQLVSDRLEAVHKGLGEMQGLAAGVGDLKRVLSNVKSRGGWGEVQLGALLAETLAPDQFAANVQTKEGSAERVEFAIRLPGRDGAEEVLLPVDAKFPIEDWERLQQAADAGDRAAVEASGRALERAVRTAAATIAEKYLNPPRTTDFALMFLPTEGLYAEVVRRPGLADALQRDHRVVPAGPTTLTALLNSLQMGFRTLAIEQRSSEVWQVLAAVKTEFGRFGPVLEKVQKKLQEASNTIDAAGRRQRAIGRRLREVEAMPAPEGGRLLLLGEAVEEAEAADEADAAE